MKINILEFKKKKKKLCRYENSRKRNNNCIDNFYKRNLDWKRLEKSVGRDVEEEVDGH